MTVTHTRTKWWLMAFSILLGIVSAWAIDRHLRNKTEEIESRTRLDQITLIVAARDLSPESILEESDVALEQFPAQWAPDDAVIAENLDDILGKRLHTEVRGGQPLLHLHLIDVEAPNISGQLAPEHKAVTLAIDGASAAAQWIRAGDRIDLIVSFDHQGKRMTAMLLHSVSVLSAGTHAELQGRNDAMRGGTEAMITVAVSQADAVKLISARENGTISAVLSSPEESVLNKKPSTAVNPPVMSDLASLLGLKTNETARIVPILYGDRLTSERDIQSESEQ